MERIVDYGTPVIDELRLCYVAEPSLLQDLSHLNTRSSRKCEDFILDRVDGDRFEFFFNIYLDEN